MTQSSANICPCCQGAQGKGGPGSVSLQPSLPRPPCPREGRRLAVSLDREFRLIFAPTIGYDEPGPPLILKTMRPNCSDNVDR